MRIVLDTASLIAALRSSEGAASEIVRLVLREELTLLMDYKLSLEYRDVALRPEHGAASGRTVQNILSLIESLEDIAEPVRVVRQIRPLSADPSDDLVLDVAINGAGDAIVTNNTKHFAPSGKRFGIPILLPAELLKQRKKTNENVD